MDILLTTVIATIVAFTAMPKSSIAREASKPKGLIIMQENGCLNCHYVQGDGGFIAPPLDGIGGHRQREDLIEKLTSKRDSSQNKKRNDRTYPSPEEFMSHVKLKPKDAENVVDYLISLPADANIAVKGHGDSWKDDFPLGSQFTAAEKSKSSMLGKKMFYKSGCIACHLVEGEGGRSGPTLDGIGAKRSRKFIERRIAGGAVVVKCGTEYSPSKYTMPPSSLSKISIKKITDYLMTLPPESKQNEASQ